MSYTVATVVLDVLRDFGVDTVFGIPGGAVSPIYGALLQRPAIRVVTAKHETNAVFMAMGYAWATGLPGVVVTTAGPGITNAVTGLASAFHDSVPVLHIAGEVARSAFGRGALQEGSHNTFDAVELMRRFTKFSAQVAVPGSAGALVRKALDTCLCGRRGPAFLSIPLDVASAPASADPVHGKVSSSFEIDSEACRRAMELLDRAERPLILAGAGARDRTSREALRRLAERVGAAVAVTPKGKGVFPEDHPSYIGVTGFGGHESVTEFLRAGVDILFACGTGLNDFATNAWTPLLGASQAFIQVDIDAAQLGKNYPVDLGLLGPIDTIVCRMLEHPLTERARPKDRRDRMSLRLQALTPSSSGRLTAPQVMSFLTAACPRDAVFTADMGEHLAAALHHLRIDAERQFITCLGFGSMGSGIVSAIGYQLGAPRRRVYAICGDGGFLMCGNDLATAVHHGVPVTYVVLNDRRLNMVHHGMRDLFGASLDFTTGEVDFAAMARSFGAEGTVIESEPDLRAALECTTTSPHVLDVRIDADVRVGASQRDAALRLFKDGPNG